jgi:LPS-assembly lipoprotein
MRKEVRSPLLGILAVVLALALAACTVRPLYAPANTEAGPQANLSAIAIEEAVTRPEQVYRNALIFAFRGGGEGAAPRYGLVYQMSFREQELAVERGTGTPNAYQLLSNVSFLLKDLGTGASLFGARVTAANTYTRSSQNYANIRARRDAEDRLAETLAGLTQARLAAYFATN